MWLKIKPWIGSIILIPFILYFALNKGKFFALDFVNLLIHEGGHGIFRIFGEFIYFAGGTIMQLLIPFLFVVVYYRSRNIYTVQFSALWLGESMINVSVYAADARAKQLPLLGGNKVIHDWWWMLNKIDMLEYDIIIGNFFFYCAVLIMISALFIPLVLIKEESKINLDLDI